MWENNSDYAPQSSKGEDQYSVSRRGIELHLGASQSTFKNAQFLRANKTETELPKLVFKIEQQYQKKIY